MRSLSRESTEGSFGDWYNQMPLLTGDQRETTFYEAPLQILLLSLFCQGEERVLDELLSKVRLRCREDSLEVSDSAT